MTKGYVGQDITVSSGRDFFAVSFVFGLDGVSGCRVTRRSIIRSTSTRFSLGFGNGIVPPLVVDKGWESPLRPCDRRSSCYDI